MTDDLQRVAPGARRISTDTDPDELVLPVESKRRLGWIADWVVQPPQVLKEWGLNRYIDGGFRALFRGPAGTGKTMAAIALGRSAGRPVFHVDLGAAISKTIGETEKNLRQIFDAAGQEGAILLFDEADALVGRDVGKRSEVKDAHDRYANVELGHLLRWLEPFEGLAILTSNSPGRIAGDAVSRIDLIVEFPMPDEAARELLWREILGALKLPQSDADVRLLARQYALSGAEILRCVRIAALIAANTDRTLDMAELQFAAAERLAMREVPQ